MAQAEDAFGIILRGEADPVQLYLALVNTGQAQQQQDIADVATAARSSLDSLYADAIAKGKAPTFNSKTTTGTYIDLSGFASRTLSAIALNTGDQFSTAEADEAKSALRSKSGAALLAGFQAAAGAAHQEKSPIRVIRMGLYFLLALMIYAHWNDLKRFGVIEKILSFF